MGADGKPLSGFRWLKRSCLRVSSPSGTLHSRSPNAFAKARSAYWAARWGSKKNLGVHLVALRCPFRIGWLRNRGAWNYPFFATAWLMNRRYASHRPLYFWRAGRWSHCQDQWRAIPRRQGAGGQEPGKGTAPWSLCLGRGFWPLHLFCVDYIPSYTYVVWWSLLVSWSGKCHTYVHI